MARSCIARVVLAILSRASRRVRHPPPPPSVRCASAPKWMPSPGSTLDMPGGVEETDAIGLRKFGIERAESAGFLGGPEPFGSAFVAHINGRRRDDQDLGLAGPRHHLRVVEDIQKAHHPGGDHIGRRSKPRLHVIGAQHDRDQIDRRVGHQRDLQPKPAIHVFAHDRIIEPRRSPGQARLGQPPALGQMAMRHARPTHPEGVPLKHRVGLSAAGCRGYCCRQRQDRSAWLVSSVSPDGASHRAIAQAAPAFSISAGCRNFMTNAAP